jgi:anti-sigma regulatory factor (Ser/Thr protein kinase)
MNAGQRPAAGAAQDAAATSRPHIALPQSRWRPGPHAAPSSGHHDGKAQRHDQHQPATMTSGTAQAAAHIELPALAVSTYWARRHAHAALGAWQIPADTTDTVLLLVSELVTNASAATTRPAPADGSALITQTLRRRPGILVIEVADNDPSPPVLADTGPDSEAGRGLILVQALSKEWSWYFPPTGGKTVYAVIETAITAGAQPR